jgi:hypothetical protein
MSPEDSPTRLRRLRRRAWLAELSSLFALAISALAFALGIYQAHLMNEQTRLMQTQSRASVWPYVSIGYALSDEGDKRGYAWQISNDGVGPARIESVTLDVDGKPVARWKDVFRAVFGDDAPVDATYSQIYGKVLPPSTNRETTIEAVHVSDPTQARAMFAAQNRFEMRICYCSVYGECWVARQRVADVTPVARCETEGTTPFEPQM